ncbi:MAG: LysR family transcriptional regulator [Hylemonella sp.]|nr:LysR family transcriptional regulator [Hylemonella sp.]
MNFRQLDLNLLRVLVALHRTGSVTAAGQVLALSQPATSHALAKLRHTLDDELFLRTPKGLMPTKLCERIAPLIQTQLAQIESTFGSEQTFDPGSSDSHWRVSLSDLGEMMFLPDLATVLRKEAPLARISNVAVTAEEVTGSLVAREIDFSIGILQSQHRNLRVEKLFEERYVAVTAADWRPSVGTAQRKLRLEQLQKAKFVVAAPTATFHGAVEKILHAHKLTNQIMLRARHFGAIPELTLNTDLLAIVPTMYAKNIARVHALRIWELPISSLKYAVNLMWHSSTDFDNAQLYVRDKVRTLFARAQ